MTFLRPFCYFILAAIAVSECGHSQQLPAKNASSAKATMSKGETALHQAARLGDVTALQNQLKQGANPNLRDQAGRTPLIVAA